MWNSKSARFSFGLIGLFLLILLKLTVVSTSSVINNMRANLSNCTLQLRTDEMKLELDEKINQGNRLIKLDITVQWNLSRPNESYPNTMLWFMTTDASGKYLMSLNKDFAAMSLGTLSYRITDLHILLVQEPEDCLDNLTANDAYELLKLSLLNLPKIQKAVNEEEGNEHHICTSFADSDGSCCHLSSTSGGVICQTLLDDKWVIYFRQVLNFLALILMSHSIYWIPRFVYEEDIDHFYQFVDKNLKLRVNVVNDEPDGNKWRKVKNTCISNLISREIKKRIRNGESIESFDLFFKSVKQKDTELVSELSNSNLLQSLYKSFENITLRCNLSKRKCWNVILRFCVIIICTSPIIFRAVLSFRIYSMISPSVYLAFTISFILLIFVYTFLPPHFFLLMNESLRELHDFNFEKKTNAALYYPRLQFQKKLSWKTFFCLPSSLVFGVLAVGIFSLPLYLFLIIAVELSWKRRRWHGLSVFGMLPIAFVCNCAIYLGVLCITFYTECIAYILIGFFLNFEQVIDTVLLILLVLIYILDLIHNVYKKLDSFNQTVFSLMFELSDKSREQLLREALANGRNTITPMQFRLNDEERKENNVKLCIDDDGKPYLSVDGLYLMHKFDKRETIPYLYIPQSFFNELASEPGHITPGKKHILFLKACREILFFLLALLAAYFIFHGFVRLNDISAVVHTLFAVGIGVALAMLNKLIFRSFESSSVVQDLHLKEQIIRHSKNFEDIWYDAEFDCSDSVAVDRPYRTDLKPDLLVKVRNGRSVEACYLKRPQTDYVFNESIFAIDYEGSRTNLFFTERPLYNFE